MEVWRRVDAPNLGFFFNFGECMSLLDARFPGVLRRVSDGVMVLASDYSGQHKGATHEAYSFLVTTDKEVDAWLPLRSEFRQRWLPDGRRLSFKRLSDSLRWKALQPYLATIASLQGNLLTFLVDRRVQSFLNTGIAPLIQCLEDCFPAGTPLGTAEKIFRHAGLLALVIAGMRQQDQRSYWISDADETLATYERREGLGRLICYLTFGFTGWRSPNEMVFGTTDSEFAPEWAEDVAAIPDLFAGTYCKLSGVLPTRFGSECSFRIVAAKDQLGVDKRARFIANWMCLASSSLRSILLRLDIDDDGKPRTTFQFFAGAM
jgi:hypothetical protein